MSQKSWLQHLKASEFPNKGKASKQATATTDQPATAGAKVIIQDKSWIDQEAASDALFNARQML